MKNWLIAILLGCCLGNLFADGKEIQLKATETDFGTKDEITWRKAGGFQLKTKTFAAIETKKRVPYSEKGVISINVKKLENIDYTVQLQMFDKKGTYLGYLDVLTKEKSEGEKWVRISKFQKNILEGTYDYSIKIWIGGKIGGYIEISQVTYKY